MKIFDELKSMTSRLPGSGFLFEAARFALHPMEELSVYADYFATRKSFRELGNIPVAAAGSGDKTALILSLSDWVYQVKTEALLALGLCMHGWKVKVLQHRFNFRGRMYFRAFGVKDFVFWDDFLADTAKAEKRKKAMKDFQASPWTFRSVKNWMYEGAKIGPQILASVSRSEMRGAPDVTDPSIRSQILQWLPKTLEIVDRAKNLLKKESPQLLFVNESNYAQNGPIVDVAVAARINTIQFVQPTRDDAFVFKRLTPLTRRYNPNSIDPETLQSIEKLPWGETEELYLQAELRQRYDGTWFLQSRNQPAVKKRSREELIGELGLDPAKKTAVIFSHVLWDANLFYGEDLFEDYGEWFAESVRAATANPRVNWIVKMHPANLWKRRREKVTTEYAETILIREKIGRLPPHVKLLFPDTDISTWSLFELADYGVTVRGTVGMELPCFGVPVFTAGTGRFSGLGFTNDSATREEYLKKLAHIEEFGKLSPEQTLLAQKHAYAVFCLRPWVMKSFRAEFHYKKRGVHPLDHNLFLVARSLEEIQKNGDLEKWAAWAEDPGRGVDYLSLST